jgi:hypothetical protein
MYELKSRKKNPKFSLPGELTRNASAATKTNLNFVLVDETGRMKINPQIRPPNSISKQTSQSSQFDGMAEQKRRERRGLRIRTWRRRARGAGSRGAAGRRIA